MSDEDKHLIVCESNGVNILACGAEPSNTNCTKRPQEVTCQACLDAAGYVEKEEEEEEEEN